MMHKLALLFSVRSTHFVFQYPPATPAEEEVLLEDGTVCMVQRCELFFTLVRLACTGGEAKQEQEVERTSGERLLHRR